MRSATDLRIEDSLGGTDGLAIVYPFWGSFKRFREVCSVLGGRHRILFWAVALYALAVVAALAVADYRLPPWWALLGLAVAAAAAERCSVRLTRNIESSISFLPFVFTAV